jgi:hypothetical protein
MLDVAGMFLVEGHPRAEWNTRIGWFRVAYGAGQVAGLLIAAAAAAHLTAGWLVTGALMLAGLGIGRIGLPALGPVPDTAGLDARASGRPVGGISWILHAFHRPALRDLTGALRSRFAVFLLTWLLTMTGVQTFFNVVPLVMRDAFGVRASASSLLFLAGAGLGTAVYPACGALADRRGPGFVLGLGLGLVITMTGRPGADSGGPRGARDRDAVTVTPVPALVCSGLLSPSPAPRRQRPAGAREPGRPPATGCPRPPRRKPASAGQLDIP